jgi:signal transduction histidine kinase
LVEDVTEFGELQQALTQDRNELLLLQNQLAQTNQELNQSNQLKSLFLSMAAHDLRSPLSVISGYVEMLQRNFTGGDSTNVQRFLLNIETQAKRMNRLVNDLLDLDLIERGQLKISPREYDFVKLVREITETEKLNFDNRRIDINLPHLPINLMLDIEKMSRVIHNLVSNACKYTPDKEKITVLVAQTEDEAIFQIMDNGQGMSPEQLENLFQPYYRTEGAKESRIEGRGLGLYIVKMLVEAHDGFVEVESALGKGSTFTVYLPIATDTEAS